MDQQVDSQLGLREIVGFFDTFPVDIIRRIVLNEGDPLLLQQIEPIVASFDEDRRERITARIVEAMEDDEFWRVWTMTSFSGITKLPAKIEKWRHLAYVIVQAVFATSVTSREEPIHRDEEEHGASALRIPPLKEWPQFSQRLQESITCSQIFDYQYRIVEVISKLDPLGPEDRWTPMSMPNAALFAPFDVIFTDSANGGIFRAGDTEGVVHVGIEFTRELDNYHLSWPEREEIFNARTEDDEWDSFVSTSEARHYRRMRCTVTIRPTAVITDAFFAKRDVAIACQRIVQKAF